MALPAFQNVGSQARTAGTSVTPAMPASIAANDTLIAQVATLGGGQTFSCGTAGWNAGGSNNSGNVSGAWFWKNAVGADTSPTITWGSSLNYDAIVIRYNGSSNSASPIGNTTSAFGNSQLSTSVPGITTSSANSLIVYWAVLDGPSKGVGGGLGSDYALRFQFGSNGNGSIGIVDGPVFISGATSAAYQTLGYGTTAFNWVGFGFEIVGSGGPGIANIRDTGVSQQVLATYSNLKFVRETGVSQQVLANYSNPKFVRATGIVIQVLRTVGTQTPPPPSGWVTIQC